MGEGARETPSAEGGQLSEPPDWSKSTPTFCLGLIKTRAGERAALDLKRNKLAEVRLADDELEQQTGN